MIFTAYSQVINYITNKFPFSLCFRVSSDSNFARNVAGVLVESGAQNQTHLEGNKYRNFVASCSHAYF